MDDSTPARGAALGIVLAENGDRLVDDVIAAARRKGYTQLTSSLREAWASPLRRLSESLAMCLDLPNERSGLLSKATPLQTAAMRFGKAEARLHRPRGVTLSLFLGLAALFHEAYDDLIAGEFGDESAQLLPLVDAFFASMEAGIREEWGSLSDEAMLEEAQDANRLLTIERDLYLTLFENLRQPVLLLDETGGVILANAAAERTFGARRAASSAAAAAAAPDREAFAPIGDEIASFMKSREAGRCLLRTLETSDGTRHFLVDLHRLTDVTSTFAGATVALTDVTTHKQLEKALRLLAEADRRAARP